MPSPLNLVSTTGITNYNNLTKNGNTNSIFNGSKFYYRPSGIGEKAKNNIDRPHTSDSSGKSTSNDLYDLSIASIIDYTKQYKSMELKPADFAYLKNVGVYPNNRLMIARRFATPVYNDLTITSHKPVSTLLTWLPPDQEEFFKISYGEEWIQEDSTLKDIFDKMIGEFTDRTLGDTLGNVVPLPGFTAGFQQEILKQLGFTDNDSSNLPDGNPNIIQSSMRRKIPMDGGSGLKTEFEIKMVVEYEQKWINNTDPTIVFLDVINNALRFGSSYSQFMFTSKLTGKFKDFFDYFRKGDWDKAIELVLGVIIDVIGTFAKGLLDGLAGIADKKADAEKERQRKEELSKIDDEDERKKREQQLREQDQADKKNEDIVQSEGMTENAVNALKKAAQTIGSSIFSKYKIQIGAVLSAMSGEPTGHWHITLGNPKRPFFASGDMVCQNVDLSFGNTLSFNDLPSSIKIEFTLKPARPLGIQEIFDRFNIGGGRTYKPIRTSMETNGAPYNDTNNK